MGRTILSFFKIPPTVEPKADGSAYLWQTVTKQKRKQLNAEDLSIRPWTSRPTTLQRGLSRQLSYPNSLEELLDIRFMKSCNKLKVSWDSPAPVNLWTEVRQDLNYQVAGGTISMLSGNRIYSYFKDRCLCGLEHLRFNGWGGDIVFEGVTEPVWNDILEEATGNPPKRKRGKKGENDIALAEMAGNAQGLPDLALFAIPLAYALRRRGLFERDIDLETITSLFVSAEGSFVSLDPNLSQQTLRAMRSKAGVFGATQVDASAVLGDDAA